MTIPSHSIFLTRVTSPSDTMPAQLLIDSIQVFGGELDGPNPVLPLFFGGVFMLLGFAYAVFRVIVRRDYHTHGRLSGWSSTLQLLAFGGLMAFPYLFNPPEWPWSWLLRGPTSRQQQILGLIIILLGFLVAFGTMGWFGMQRAFGLEAKGLIRGGLYRFTRNPQILSGYLLVIGVSVQWPSLYAIIWVALYGLIGHWMVLTEEEHLLALLGDEYARYCRQVPRYLFQVENLFLNRE